MSLPVPSLHVRALEHYRRRAGKSRSEVLAAAGITVERFEVLRVTSSFTIDDIARLAQALETTPRELSTLSAVLTVREQLG